MNGAPCMGNEVFAQLCKILLLLLLLFGPIKSQVWKWWHCYQGSQHSFPLLCHNVFRFGQVVTFLIPLAFLQYAFSYMVPIWAWSCSTWFGSVGLLSLLCNTGEVYNWKFTSILSCGTLTQCVARTHVCKHSFELLDSFRIVFCTSRKLKRWQMLLRWQL